MSLGPSRPINLMRNPALGGLLLVTPFQLCSGLLARSLYRVAYLLLHSCAVFKVEPRGPGETGRPPETGGGRAGCTQPCPPPAPTPTTRAGQHAGKMPSTGSQRFAWTAGCQGLPFCSAEGAPGLGATENTVPVPWGTAGNRGLAEVLEDSGQLRRLGRALGQQDGHAGLLVGAVPLSAPPQPQLPPERRDPG